jgi:hypothetical protein
MTAEERRNPLDLEAGRIEGRLRFALARLADACKDARLVMAEAEQFLARLEGPVAVLPAAELFNPAELEVVPQWDRARRVLAVGGRIVKQYRVPSANQGTVLDAFQHEGWPRRIDDPLTYRAGRDPKYRLHFTINRLNQSQQQRLIRFFGDGTGEGVCWELYDAASPSILRPAAILKKDRRAA